jgi:hypothetical protein
MADLLDQEAKRRGVSRAALMAMYQKQMTMRGINGVAAQQDFAGATPRPAPARPKVDNRGPLQRIMDALGGN